jgi:hypothetical protein
MYVACSAETLFKRSDAFYKSSNVNMMYYDGAAGHASLATGRCGFGRP